MRNYSKTAERDTEIGLKRKKSVKAISIGMERERETNCNTISRWEMLRMWTRR